MLSVVMRFPWVPGCNGYNTDEFVSGITPWASVATIKPDKKWGILASEYYVHTFIGWGHGRHYVHAFI
jgi:hypothetical protein